MSVEKRRTQVYVAAASGPAARLLTRKLMYKTGFDVFELKLGLPAGFLQFPCHRKCPYWKLGHMSSLAEPQLKQCLPFTCE